MVLWKLLDSVWYKNESSQWERCCCKQRIKLTDSIYNQQKHTIFKTAVDTFIFFLSFFFYVLYIFLYFLYIPHWNNFYSTVPVCSFGEFPKWFDRSKFSFGREMGESNRNIEDVFQSFIYSLQFTQYSIVVFSSFLNILVVFEVKDFLKESLTLILLRVEIQ